MFDGLRKLLGLVGAAPAKKPLVNYGGGAGRAVAAAARNMPQAIPARAPIAPMSQDNQITNQMVQQGELPLWRAELYQQGSRSRPQGQPPRPTWGPQPQQEDDGMVWGPQGMQPLNQVQQGQPWVNASGPFKRPRY